ncbi:MAG: ABC transporter permease [Bdellovibrionales bacterium]
MKTVIRPQKKYSFIDDMKELWNYRELICSWSMREVSIRYKQAVVGVLWVVLQPLIMAGIYTLVFSYLAKIPSDGAPYPIFVLSGLILWQFFSRSLVDGANSLITNSEIITKVYFPRQILPLSVPCAAMIDAMIAYVVLFILALFFGMLPGFGVLLVPFVLIGAALLAFGMGLWIAPINGIYRDVGIALPFLVHIAMFITPVIYPVSFAPDHLQWLFYLNPMATLIEVSRWAFLGTPFPGLEAIGIFVVVVSVVLIGGLRVFRKMETTLIDRI